jgi:hypothetical protein
VWNNPTHTHKRYWLLRTLTILLMYRSSFQRFYTDYERISARGYYATRG